jgi:excisionase family DNA binding protein
MNDEQGAAEPATVPVLPRQQPRFLSVGAVARSLGMSEATMYRAVRAGEFPAVRVRGRYVIPGKVLDALEDAAMTSGTMIDAADYVDGKGVA